MRLLVSAILAASILMAASASNAAPLTSTGRWITDDDGRVRILHGTNLVAKARGQTPLDVGFDEDDVDLLLANGVNTVRLGLNWTSVEPEPGVIDGELPG